MTGKARFIFPVVMAFMMAFVVSAVITFVNLGFAPDFLSRWMRAFAIAWPSAAFVAFFALPVARAITAAIVERIGE
ncbi:DUF2798 domain-containing protein [Bosea sp. PAMC 26642]|uniref:DUF2798 domain-containing protein n=1 Tax=Bosea sp. (strain PAMC 26642) TaxID=1792307 RepID=UPI00077028E4|nr:DUF2798 domain-containing protein [Bosea sp. PAMC 26642]AMJ63103.1 hypothetical protein AXW83_24860 [Bosea sp. PAMC 26642]